MLIRPVQFLAKQTATLKRLNESRVRIYEQIETSLSELEENHNKLTEESAWEKVKIKRCRRVFRGCLIMLEHKIPTDEVQNQK